MIDSKKEDLKMEEIVEEQKQQQEEISDVEESVNLDASDENDAIEEEVEKPTTETRTPVIQMFVEDSRYASKKFLKSVYQDESKPEIDKDKWSSLFLQQLALHIVAPHSFSKEGRLAFLSPEGTEFIDDNLVSENSRVVSYGSKDWLEKHIERVKFYSPYKNASRAARKLFYKKLLRCHCLKMGDLFNGFARFKRYGLFSSKKIDRQNSLNSLFKNIYVDAIKTVNSTFDHKVSEKMSDVVYISNSGSKKTLGSKMDISDLVIFVNNLDLEDLKGKGFDLKSCKLDFVEMPSLLPGEYLIAHRMMNVLLRKEDENSFKLGIGDSFYIRVYGMPMKFKASEESYFDLFLGPWSVFNSKSKEEEVEPDESEISSEEENE